MYSILARPGEKKYCMSMYIFIANNVIILILK